MGMAISLMLVVNLTMVLVVMIMVIILFHSFFIFLDKKPGFDSFLTTIGDYYSWLYRKWKTSD